MPIIIDHLADPPSGSVIEATSSDGILYAKYDPVWAGVFLKADWTANKDATLIVRVNFDGTQDIVRGSNMGETIADIHIGYDHEPHLGETSSWYAVPFVNGVA